MDVEVRIASQPNYPLQCTIAEVAIIYPDETGSDDDGPADDAERREASKTIVYIGEGSQVYDAPYLPAAAAEALGWR